MAASFAERGSGLLLDLHTVEMDVFPHWFLVPLVRAFVLLALQLHDSNTG